MSDSAELTNRFVTNFTCPKCKQPVWEYIDNPQIMERQYYQTSDDEWDFKDVKHRCRKTINIDKDGNML